MKIVVDTNVFISGVFFAGLPYEILNAWRCGIVRLVISPPIFDEYRRVGAELACRFPKGDKNSAVYPSTPMCSAGSLCGYNSSGHKSAPLLHSTVSKQICTERKSDSSRNSAKTPFVK